MSRRARRAAPVPPRPENATAQNPLVPYLDALFASSPSYLGQPWTAKQWAEVLSGVIPERDHYLATKMNAGWIGWAFTEYAKVFAERYGFEAGRDTHTKTKHYVFHRCLVPAKPESLSAVDAY